MYPPKSLAAFIAEVTNTAATSAESAPLHKADDVITIPRALLDQLMDLPPEALKVYIYLRSLDQGQAFPVPRPDIGAGVGRKKRCISESVKVLLREKGLITVTKGKGGHPNRYSFPSASKAGPMVNPLVVTASELEAVPAMECEAPAAKDVETPVPAAINDSQAATLLAPKSGIGALIAGSELSVVPAAKECEAPVLPPVRKTAKDGEEAPVPARINDPQPTAPFAPKNGTSKLIPVCLRPANDVIKVLKLMIQQKTVLLNQFDSLKQDDDPQASVQAATEAVLGATECEAPALPLVSEHAVTKAAKNIETQVPVAIDDSQATTVAPKSGIGALIAGSGLAAALAVTECEAPVPAESGDQPRSVAAVTPESRIRELVAAYWRPANDVQLLGLNKIFSGEAVLLDKLEPFKHNGNKLEPSLGFIAFVAALKQDTPVPPAVVESETSVPPPVK